MADAGFNPINTSGTTGPSGVNSKPAAPDKDVTVPKAPEVDRVTISEQATSEPPTPEKITRAVASEISSLPISDIAKKLLFGESSKTK